MIFIGMTKTGGFSCNFVVGKHVEENRKTANIVILQQDYYIGIYMAIGKHII